MKGTDTSSEAEKANPDLDISILDLGGRGGKTKNMKYENRAWEPYFHIISPALAKLYFATNVSVVKKICASLIFKKVTYMEKRYGNW